jgi:spermidine synthase
MPTAIVILFSASMLASALLVFLVQPMVGKQILPWFGGAAGVWALCLAFYQSTLFLGYAYAHWLNQRFRPGTQILIHAGLFVAALIALPVLPDKSWADVISASPSGLGASATILQMLTTNVAVPFLFLSATGPLLQAWFARALPERRAYALYAVSNLGSFVALGAYPFFIEPELGLSDQADAWSWGFAVCGGLILACGLLARASTPRESTPASRGKQAFEPGQRAIWALLSAGAVMLLMATTNELCRDMASVPFLWIVPLAIYLLTFVLCFGSELLYQRAVFVPLSILSLVGVGWGPELVDRYAPALVFSAAVPLEVVFFSFALFCGCSVAHGELYRIRPPSEQLTAFYLWVSAGGAAGGLFVGVAAPLLFSDFYELPLAWALCWALFGLICRRDRERGLGNTRLIYVGAAFAIAIAGFAAMPWGTPQSDLLLRERNFFGVLRVLDVKADEPKKHRIVLHHGNTVHGFQLQSPKLRNATTAYYGELTGVGCAVHAVRARGPAKIGVIGLGIGTMAAYAGAEDEVQFYELDPDVLRIARDSGHFSYLADSSGQVDVTLGDARLSLQQQLRETGGNDFGLLVVDAFSGDAIPVHLVTREAVALYLEHLAPDGVMAFHVSNRSLNLTPLIFRLADALELEALEIANQPLGLMSLVGARWILVARRDASFEAIEDRVRAIRRRFEIPLDHLWMQRPTPARIVEAPLWTDDYSNLFSLLSTRTVVSTGRDENSY